MDAAAAAVLQVGFNYREGLVLHQLGYKDGDRVRPVMHRASLVEMAGGR
jgi:primary-amine oxidase